MTVGPTSYNIGWALTIYPLMKRWNIIITLFCIENIAFVPKCCGFHSCAKMTIRPNSIKVNIISYTCQSFMLKRRPTGPSLSPNRYINVAVKFRPCNKNITFWNERIKQFTFIQKFIFWMGRVYHYLRPTAMLT